MVTLKYPYGAPTLIVTIQNPEFNDSYDVDHRLSFKVDMAGLVRTYKIIPETKKLLLTFGSMPRTMLENLKNFIHLSAGSLIELTDHNGIVWSGLITNQPFESTSSSRFLKSTTIEFEGEIV